MNKGRERRREKDRERGGKRFQGFDGERGRGSLVKIKKITHKNKTNLPLSY